MLIIRTGKCMYGQNFVYIGEVLILEILKYNINNKATYNIIIVHISTGDILFVYCHS